MNMNARHRIRRWIGRLCLGATVCGMITGLARGQSRTYTLDADFDEGSLQNVNHNIPNQLQLNTTAVPLPFVWVACSGLGTVVKIDANTCTVLGEYLTSPDGMGRDPSRTTVDLLGNAWVSNRAESGVSGGQNKGSVARVGLLIGGTRCDAAGTPDPSGQYVKPPFQYNTCADRDGDGLIKTSFGLGNVLSWTNAGGADIDGGVTTADDECIINYTRIVGSNARTVAVDANNDVWTGGLGDLDHEKLSGLTGQPVANTQFNLGCGGYGGLIDGNGVLWSARGGANLLRFVPNPSPPPAGAGVCLDTSHGDYGLGLDPVTGHIWHTSLGGGFVAELSPAGAVLNTYPHGSVYAQGVAVDHVGNVWVAHSLVDPSTTVGHLRTGGTFVGNVPVGVGPTGVAVDSSGKVWVTNYYSDNAMRIDPNAGGIGGGGFPIGAVDCTVALRPGSTPYNYSDMTGAVSQIIGGNGTWTVVYDTGAAGTSGCDMSWTSSEPAGTSVGVEVRAADNPADLPSQLFVSVTNGGPTGVTGRYVEIRATLSRDQGINDTPILYDLTIQCNEPPDCSHASAGPSQLWPPNHQFVPITILGVTDPDGDPIAITITSIFQDERVLQSGDGSGNTSPDGKGVGTATANVRSERNGNPKTPGNGRVYHIGFTADDGNGGTCKGSVLVCVPHDQRPGATCVDGGALFNSTVSP